MAQFYKGILVSEIVALSATKREDYPTTISLRCGVAFDVTEDYATNLLKVERILRDNKRREKV